MKDVTMPTVANARLVSIVVPVYAEAKNLTLLVDAIDRAAPDRYRWEYVFVNDGSPDNSLEVLQQIAATNPRVRIIDLSRNFGKEAALSAGLAHASGDAVICIDADLQHPPALIPTFLAHWEQGAEVVVSVREETEQPSMVRRAGSAVFYWLLTRMSEVEVVGKSTDYRLLDRRVVDAFLELADRDRLVRGLVDWLGFRRVCVTFTAPGADARRLVVLRTGGSPHSSSTASCRTRRRRCDGSGCLASSSPSRQPGSSGSSWCTRPWTP